MKPLQHKGFSVSSTLGKDVVELLNQAIEGASQAADRQAQASDRSTNTATAYS